MPTRDILKTEEWKRIYNTKTNESSAGIATLIPDKVTLTLLSGKERLFHNDKGVSQS